MAITTVHLHLNGEDEARVVDLAVELDPGTVLVAITEALGVGPAPAARAGLSIDCHAREVSLNGRAIPLTKREFDLLAFLASHPRQVFSRNELLGQVWGSSVEWQVASTVTEHVRRIRQKLTDVSGREFIENVRGVGYRFSA